MASQPQSQSRGSQARQQPESLRLRSMMPTFTVGDIERSVAWYRDGLGFYVAERWEDGGKLRGARLKAGATAELAETRAQCPWVCLPYRAASSLSSAAARRSGPLPSIGAGLIGGGWRRRCAAISASLAGSTSFSMSWP